MSRLISFLVLIIGLILSGSILGADFVKYETPTDAAINKVFFTNDRHGVAVTSKGELMHTSNSGKTWKSKELTKRAIRDIHIIGRNGYLAGDKGLLMKSTDGGYTWRDVSLDLKFNFSGVGIINDSSIVVCGTNQNSMSKAQGVMFISYDYGKNWKKQKHWGNGYTDVKTIPTFRVYVLAIKKALHSVSGGLHFFNGKYEGSRLCLGFDFMNDWGFMVGYDGYFARSTDHGRNWEEVPIDITKTLYAVEMFDKFSGIAVGQDGLIVTFSGSGDRYTVEQCGETIDLKTVEVTDNMIFCAGLKGSFFALERFPKAKN
ncbi:MAG: hypothetical protein KAR42_11515 [candidate division Zixibacteria bacterium]|nr:hypothetical protein [candidate division Zixibacteria bacterium]